MGGEGCWTLAPGAPPWTFEVLLRGEIDLANRAELENLIAAYARSLDCDVVVDLGQVTFIDVTGLGLLVDLFREARVRGAGFILRRVPPMTRRLLRAAGLEQLLPAEPLEDRPTADMVGQRDVPEPG